MGVLFWRWATRAGALPGLLSGFAITTALPLLLLCHYYCFAITTALPLIRSHSMEIVADEKGVGRKFRRFFNRELFHCVQGTSGQELARLPTVEP